MHENQHAERLSLDGIWQIEIAEQKGTLTVPSVWEVQGYSRDATHTTLEREFDVPVHWAGTQVILKMSAVSYDVTIAVNGYIVGQHIGMWSAFEFDVSAYLQFGVSNTITATIIKPSNTNEGEYPYRNVLVGFVPYISSTFGGIWQSVELSSFRGATWQNIVIQPNFSDESVYIQAQLNTTNTDTAIKMVIRDAQGEVLTLQETSGSYLDINVPVPDIQYWQTDNPYLYTLELHADDALATRQFGFRELRAVGRDLLLNGEYVFLRGILSWGWNPETLAPVFTDEFIREEFQRVRELGFNLYKLCLYIPPENLLRIADEEGMLLWLEMPMWWQIDNPHLREQMPKEYAEIIAQIHHHPSIILVSLGCEIEGHMVGEGLIRQLESIVRQQMKGILLCENSGSGEAYHGLTADIADFYDYHFYSDAHYFQPMIQHFRRDWRTPRPWIFGEFAAQDDYRNPENLVDEGGEPFWWRELLGTDGGIHRWAYRDQEERVEALSLPYTHEELQALSRKQSYAFRKLILETTRRNEGVGGYVITGLRDTPITSSGIWDDHLYSKYPAEMLRQINNENVLLLEQGRQRIWIEGDRPYPTDKFNHWAGTQADFYILFSGLTIPDTPLHWQLQTVAGEIIVSGEQTIKPIPVDANPHQIARIMWDFPKVAHPTKVILYVKWGAVNNQWNLWVYPKNTGSLSDARLYDPTGVLHHLNNLQIANLKQENQTIIASALTQELQTAIELGTNVILLQSGQGTLPTKQISFWQESLNLVLEHPLWESISHDGITTEQFYHVAGAFGFDPIATAYQPVLRRLHTRLFTATDMIIDMQIGQGRLLATTLNLLGGAGDQAFGIENNVFGAYLFAKMITIISNS